MNLKECYELMGSDYNGVISRLRNESIIIKYITKFLDDKSYESMIENYKNENLEETYRAVHTLKGIALNFSFTDLAEDATNMCEDMKAKRYCLLEKDIEAVSASYKRTVDCIKQFIQNA